MMRHLTVILFACVSFTAARADDPAPTAYPAGADALVGAIAALTNAEDKRIGLWRSENRYGTIRAALVQSVISSKGDAASVALDDNAVKALLCNPRKDFIKVSASQNYLTAVSSELKKTATTAKIDGLTAAITTLFKTYSVDVATVDGKLKKAQELALGNCQIDYQKFPKSYYNYAFAGSTVAIEDIFSPFSSLVKLVIDIVTPVAEAGAKLVDAEARKAAILAYLKKPGTIKNITAAAQAVDSELSSSLNAYRYQKVGQFVEQVVILRGDTLDLNKEPACKSSFKDDKLIVNDGRPSDNFIKCMSVTSAFYADKIASLLKTADDYDQLADAPPDVTGEKLKAITGKLDQIANDKVPPATTKELWDKAVEIMGFAQTVLNAASKENRAKVKQGIDDLVKAL
ncbi:hypothetical protein V1283_004596 [Bradyrhizobium sp. AZCC 2262]|uniref:hypothetical protein n=1 Tax=Bradyrhizobium sp. AZCC 2262 TaxID=3117022 RepID=UPI002FF2F036